MGIATTMELMQMRRTRPIPMDPTFRPKRRSRVRLSPEMLADARAQLRASPGVWGLIRPVEYKTAMSARTMAGKMRRNPEWEGFEVEADERKIYARFVGVELT